MESETKTARIYQKSILFYFFASFSKKFRIQGNQKHQFLKGDIIKVFGLSVDNFSNQPEVRRNKF